MRMARNWHSFAIEMYKRVCYNKYAQNYIQNA